MLPLIYTHIVYALLFGIVFVLWAGSELLGPARWHGAKDAKKRDQGSLALGLITGVLGVILYFLFPLWLPATTISWNQPLVFGVGGALMVLAVGWRWYALLTLGRYYTGIVALHPDQPVVQHGPFKVVRHPSYLGVLLIILGIGIMMENWASLLSILTGLLIGLLYRIQVEEKALCHHFGDAYVEYMQRTKKRLVPFVY